MKIIFLDIDGVLVTPKSAAGATSLPLPLDRRSTALLLDLCRRPDRESSEPGALGDACLNLGGGDPVRIVVSSSWRRQFTRDEIFEHFESFGFPRELFHEDWRTVDLDSSRGLEIAEWLSRHPECAEQFIILDDDCDFLPGQLRKHVQTTWEDGFTVEHFRQAWQLLHETSAARPSAPPESRS